MEDRKKGTKKVRKKGDTMKTKIKLLQRRKWEQKEKKKSLQAVNMQYKS